MFFLVNFFFNKEAGQTKHVSTYMGSDPKAPIFYHEQNDPSLMLSDQFNICIYMQLFPTQDISKTL